MRLDTMTAEIRPRSDWEAVDLGLAMVRRDFWRCLAVWWLALMVPTVLAGWWLWESPSLWLLFFWWWKPAGSRLVMFEVSRRLFGEKPTWRASLREIPKAWVRRFFYRYVMARFSPWLPVTLAVEDLEGLRGNAYKQRCNQVTRRGEGVIMWIYLVSDLAACWFGVGLFFLVLMMIPEGQDGAWQAAADSFDWQNPTEIPGLIMRTVVICVMVAISLTDVFVTGAGFGVYVNNRTWIEGWDVELAFKRLARRLTKVAVLLVWLGALSMPMVSGKEAESDPSAVIREVKADRAFKVHTVTDKIPKPSSTSWKWPAWLRFGNVEMLGRLFVVCAVVLLVGLIGWLIWLNRHAFLIRNLSSGESARLAASARVVMGMEVSPETLPDDVPAAALMLWRQGRHQEALGLLYRGAISRVIELARVEIEESDTEGDCMRRVDQAGALAHPDYFRGITGAWVRMAYAGTVPADVEIESLCQQWPFVERRKA